MVKILKAILTLAHILPCAAYWSALTVGIPATVAKAILVVAIVGDWVVPLAHLGSLSVLALLAPLLVVKLLTARIDWDLLF